MAAKKPDSTVTPGVDIPGYVADNYRGLVEDENRNVTYDSIADDADASGDVNLAAWARQEAKNGGKDITPTDATPDLAQVKRDADKAAKAANGEDHVKTVDETGQVDATDTPGVTPPTGLPVDYSGYTVAELEVILDDRGIDRSEISLKADLVAALETDDK